MKTSQWLAVFIGVTVSGCSLWGEAPAALQLSTTLSWERPWAGDPLRVQVRLSSPLYQVERMRQVEEIQAGSTNLTPITTQPALTADWYESLHLSLIAVQVDGSHQELLSAAQWNAALRSQSPGVSALEERSVNRSREWMLAPEVLQLKPGSHLVQVSWNGVGRGLDAFLPANGILVAPEVSFQVETPQTPADQASHFSRLAFLEYMRGAYAAARDLGRQAIQLDPQNVEPDRVQNHLLAASAAFRAGDALQAAWGYQTLLELLPEPESETRALVRGQLSVLAPELREVSGGEIGQPLRMQLLAIPNQTYVIHSSTDLSTWVALSTNRPATNATQILGHPVSTTPQFYRAVWVQP